tara:strand:+ start:1150 stop:1620 length:471 start_codon:yes stop_codon:yes gene_type:complete
MMVRNILLLFLISIISVGCGFNPMYSKTSNINFEIISVEFTGNSQMNNFIENRLNKYSKTSSDKKFNIKINTRFQKISLAKDTTGKTTDFNLICTLDLIFISENEGTESQVTSFSENIIVKNNENKNEQSNYEKNVIDNLSQLLLNRLVFQLSKRK